MHTTSCHVSQATIVAAQRNAFYLDWRLQDPDDSDYFVMHPDARYRVRQWRIEDDWSGHQVNEAFDMTCYTIVYRSGCRDFRSYPYGGRRAPIAWDLAHRAARSSLRDCPELGIGDDYQRPRYDA